MPIVKKTPQGQVEAELRKITNRLKNALLYHLQVIGEKVVKEARLHGDYTDRTGNLRSSIGYVIVQDGRIVTLAGFIPVKGGVDGTKEGETFAKTLVANYPKGIALIVVAGMRYATYVAARKNVLDSSELQAEKLVDQMCRTLGITKQ